ASHSEPPWPLAAVQPGLVLGEALVDRIAPGSIPLGPGRHLSLASPSEREWLSLVIPVASFLALGLLLAMAAATLISVTAPGLAAGARLAAAATVALAFLLDPEAQHFATGGFTELPYTLGAVCALLLVANGVAQRRPLLFGLLLGFTGSFRANMLWL